MDQQQMPGIMCPRPCAPGEYIYVNGEEMAYNYPVVAGDTVRFIDVSGKFDYIKHVPMDLRLPFDFIRVKKEFEVVQSSNPPQVQQPQVDMSNYVTKEQFDSVTEKLNTILANMQDNQRYNGKRNHDRDKEVNPNAGTK